MKEGVFPLAYDLIPLLRIRELNALEVVSTSSVLSHLSMYLSFLGIYILISTVVVLVHIPKKQRKRIFPIWPPPMVIV